MERTIEKMSILRKMETSYDSVPKQMHDIRGQFICVSLDGSFHIVHDFSELGDPSTKEYRCRNGDLVHHVSADKYKIERSGEIITRED